jgi:hypothetical protein
MYDSQLERNFEVSRTFGSVGRFKLDTHCSCGLCHCCSYSLLLSKGMQQLTRMDECNKIVCVCVCVRACAYGLTAGLFWLSSGLVMGQCTQFSYCCVASRLFVLPLGSLALGSTTTTTTIIIIISNNNNNNLAKYGALMAFLMKLPYRDDRMF